jgi:hypothetical protein
MDSKIGRRDKNIGPNASNDFVLPDQLTSAFKQDDQDLQSPTSEGHGFVTFQQKKLCRKQSKRSE